MRNRALSVLVVGAALLLAACSSSGATAAPSAAAPTAQASAPASTAASSPAAGGAACSQSATAGQVAVTIKNFAFGPADIQAKVGDTVTATLDDGSCTTGTISPGTADGLTFTAAGTYPFHCKIHSSMTGKITVS